MTRMHNDHIIVIVQQKPDSDASQMIWVPVRVHKKPKHKGGNVITYICCFCDMVTRNNCLHAKFAFQSCNEQLSTCQSQSTETVQVSTYMRFEDAVSQLPLTRRHVCALLRWISLFVKQLVREQLRRSQHQRLVGFAEHLAHHDKS